MPNRLSFAGRPTVRRIAGRVSALTLLAGLGAGCSADAVRLNEPIFTGLAPNQREILTSQIAAPTMAVATAATLPTGHVHTVRAGDSVWSVAAAYGVTVDALARANGLEEGAIWPGQELKIPAAGASEPTVQVASIDPKGQIATDAPAVAAAPAPERQPVETEAAPGAPEPAAAPAPVEAAEPARDTGPGFRWPVRGQVISGFGKKPNGEHNEGINLAVPEGTSIKAAEDGTVIYAGNELKSYGNLVLIRHTNGFVSAYAHSKEIWVKRGEQVRRGQIIAQAGMTGDVDAPQVHFELRKGVTPVNPLDYLAEG